MTRRHLSKPRRRRGRGLALARGTLLAVALGVLAPAAADARPPRITVPPVISGTPQVGATLVAGGAAWDPRSGTTTSWQWLRCGSLGQGTCSTISGATASSYAVAQADLGKYLRAVLYVRNDDGWAWSPSAATAAVTAAPKPQPTPDPEPSPSPSPSPVPQPEPSPVAQPEPVVAPAPAAAAPVAPAPAADVRGEAKALRMMDPAPIVRVRGRLTRSGARITLLTVRAPRSARIAVRCLGRGCPARRWARPASLIRIARFEAALPAGTRLVITVTKPGRIGKHTTVVVGRAAAPTRRDRCLMPGARKPTRCPAA